MIDVLMVGLLIEFLLGFCIGCVVGYWVRSYKEE